MSEAASLGHWLAVWPQQRRFNAKCAVPTSHCFKKHLPEANAGLAFNISQLDTCVAWVDEVASDMDLAGDVHACV